MLVVLNVVSNLVCVTLSLLFIWENVFFFISVLFIALMIFCYTAYYIEFTLFLLRFQFLFFVFLVSILILIISGDVFILFLGWDGLGVSSYCLVVFYLNYKSLNAGSITMLLNRLGDRFLLVFFCLFFLRKGWDITSFSLLGFSLRFLWLILVVAFSKSAQFPFRRWLPLAMAAPTPISALVHSSTLVTAGIFVLLKFAVFLRFNVSCVVFILSLFVLIYSGVSSVFELDFKKIIALSTLRQLALILVALGLGLKFLAFLHLVFHAYFKSLLFLNFGVLIHLEFSNQDGRLSSFVNSFLFVSSSIGVLSLVALFFVSGFYRKDLLLESVRSFRLAFWVSLVFFMLIGFTFIYSVRLLMVLIFGLAGQFFGLSSFSGFVGVVLSCLSVVGIFFGSLLIRNFLFFVLSRRSLKFTIFFMVLLWCFVMFGLTVRFLLFGQRMFGLDIVYVFGLGFLFWIKSLLIQFEKGYLEGLRIKFGSGLIVSGQALIKIFGVIWFFDLLLLFLGLGFFIMF